MPVMKQNFKMQNTVRLILVVIHEAPDTTMIQLHFMPQMFIDSFLLVPSGW
jgi:hypothetical protein